MIHQEKILSWFDTTDRIELLVIEQNLRQSANSGFLILPLEPPEQHPLDGLSHGLRVGLKLI